ncbi:MAG: nuclear transport factor 2 family protein [Planctomycetes bacterium]|nr:nuclear transport factor 2 family protein [Planctomycetota bacterium]
MKLQVLLVALLLFAPLFAMNQDDTTPTQDQLTGLETVDGAVDRLYEVISFEGGGQCDWERMNELFMPGAIFVMPTRPGGDRKTQSLEEFQAGFKAFIANSEAKEKGFHEFNLHRSITEFGDTAHVHSVYEARFGKSGKKVLMSGIDSIQLIRIKGLWHVVCIATENATAERPIPKEFIGK